MRKSILLTAVLLLAWVISAEPALKDVFEDAFYIGVAVNSSQIYGKDPNEQALIVKHFNSITPENALKWQSVHPLPQQYNFDTADRFVELGTACGMFIVGHTLIWHNQVPDWVFEDGSGNPITRQALLERMRDHIHTVVGRYKGMVHGWDVVNEALTRDGQLRKTPWLEIIGEDYIQKAFEYAHQADPNAQLYYNDYSIEDPGKRVGVVRLVAGLKAAGVRIDGVGIQGHWNLDYPRLQDLEDSIRLFSALDVNVMITELDIDVLPSGYTGADITAESQATDALDPYKYGLPDYVQQRLADRYAQIFCVLYAYAGQVSRVTFWGLHDGVSWKNNWPVRGRTNYPLLFDRDLLPKPAFFAVIGAAGATYR